MGEVYQDKVSDLAQRSLALLYRPGGITNSAEVAAAQDLLLRVRERGEVEYDLNRRVSLQRILDQWREAVAAGQVTLLHATKFDLAPLDERFRDSLALGRIGGSEVADLLRDGRAVVGAIITDHFALPPSPVRFVDCRFIGTQLRRAKFPHGSSFIRCSFESVSFQGAVLEGATFIDCVLRETSLRSTRQSDTAFINSVLDVVDLSGADARNVLIAQCAVSRTTTNRRTNLRDAFVGTGTLLTDTTWTEADLRGAYFWQVVARRVTLDRCRLDRARLGWVSGRDLVFRDVTARATLVLESSLGGVAVEGGDWSAAEFRDCVEVDRLHGGGELGLARTASGRAFVVSGRAHAAAVRRIPRSGDPERESVDGPTARAPDPWKADWIVEAIQSGRPLVSIQIDREAVAALGSLGDTPIRFVDCRFSSGVVEEVRLAPGTTFTSCRFDRKTAFRRASLAGIAFSDCLFDAASFDDTIASDAAFINCLFRSCRMVGADFDRAVIARSALVGCRADGSTTFRDASFCGGTVLDSSVFRSTVFSGARFGDATFRSASFQACAMEGAQFVGVRSVDCVVRRVELRGASAFDCHLPEWDVPSPAPTP